MTAPTVAAALDLDSPSWRNVMAAALAEAGAAGTVTAVFRHGHRPPVTARLSAARDRFYYADAEAAGEHHGGGIARNADLLGRRMAAIAEAAAAGPGLPDCAFDDEAEPEPPRRRHLSTAAAQPPAEADGTPNGTPDPEAEPLANTEAEPSTVPRGTRTDLDALAAAAARTRPPSTIASLPHTPAAPSPTDRLSAPLSHTETEEPRYPMSEPHSPLDVNTAAPQTDTAVMLAAVTLYPGFESYINPERIVRLFTDHYGAQHAVFAQLQDTDAHGAPLVYPVTGPLDDEQDARDALDIVAARLTGDNPQWPDRPHWRPPRTAPPV